MDQANQATNANYLLEPKKEILDDPETCGDSNLSKNIVSKEDLFNTSVPLDTAEVDQQTVNIMPINIETVLSKEIAMYQKALKSEDMETTVCEIERMGSIIKTHIKCEPSQAEASLDTSRSVIDKRTVTSSNKHSSSTSSHGQKGKRVPLTPPAKIPQPWERVHETEAVAGMARQRGEPPTITEPLPETAEDDEIIEGSPPHNHSMPSMDHGLETAEDDEIIEGSPPHNHSMPSMDHGLGIPKIPMEEGTLQPCTPPESTSSLGTPPQAKKRKLLFTPSTGIIPALEAPVNPVAVQIEFLEFAPESTTSAMPGSGRSAASYEIGVDGNVDEEIDDNVGSDIDEDADVDDLIDISVRQRNVFEFPTEFDGSEDPGLVEAVHELDAENDVRLRALTESEDFLNFDWRGNADNFKGVREEFIGPSGPTFDISGLTPLEIFEQIWDTNIVAHIVRETNKYGRQLQLNNASKLSSRLSRWKDTTEDEIWTFFGIIMLQSLVVNNVEREYWYPKLEELRVGNFGELMGYNRFLLLKRCLHFVDNTSLPAHTNKLHKIMPVIEHLNQKFSSLYLPEQNVAIDESLLLWKGRLSFAQLIATKRARVGIKSYELCESRTGYLWNMEVYTGKAHVHAPQDAPQEADVTREVEDERGSATSQIVLTLMRPLFNRGHTLVMDNFYNAPLLSRLLKAKYKTDTMGTLRLNRDFVPESLKGKNKNNMKAGEVCFSTTKDLSVVVWMDKNVVAMLSTYHDIKVGGKEKYGYFRYKPEVVLDYNLSMGGIDHKDQMLHAYPVERVRNMVWYKKLFRRLLNVSIHNAYVIYTHDHTQIGNRDFRLQLAHQILQKHKPTAVPRPPARPPAQPATPPEMHLPLKNVRAQRCKLCHAAKVRRTTVWRCGTCDVNLCIEGCYSAYHTSNRYIK
ncbi:piggyBac transposable element-derived protein 4-like [Maniola jurtina]|uniref:piggyBac transposable element-derived protein 4-like n=1 Tax=Maniola jurtina TaxID=191418 RepID=UPI001E689C6B|nr:piggyBac transposable element-derived protein 4-like [Maniola jurtina]XP_045783279.1 piggyBac transposable element-derived protein 4-like [Maniola jurtina]